MEESIWEKQPIYKRKALIIPLSILITAGVVYALVLLFTVPTTVTITEGLTLNTPTLEITGHPGETISEDIILENVATVSYVVAITWLETNANGVIYTTPFDTTAEVTVAPGLNNIPVEFVINSGSPIGVITGDVQIDRI